MADGKEVWAENSLLNIEDFKQYNCLISGANNTMKTWLAVGIEKWLRANGFKTVVFDVIGVWKHRTDLPVYQVLPKKQRIPIKPNICYDMAYLKQKQQLELIQKVLRYIWLSRINQPNPQPFYGFVEEAQLTMKSARAKEEVLRAYSSGRNLAIRLCMITPDLALLDASFIRLADIRFHSRLNPEENGIRKFKSFYGSETSKLVQNLKVGQLLYYNCGNIQLVEFPRPNCEATNIATLGNWSGNPVSFTNKT